MPVVATLGAYIGPAFRKIRKETGMSQSSVCKALNKATEYRGFISKIETGTGGTCSNMSIKTLTDLARAIGTRPSIIVREAEEMLGRNSRVTKHLCPPQYSHIMPCCQRSTRDPAVIDDQMTIRASDVTCPGPQIKEK